MSKKNILVTGGAGFIGSAFVRLTAGRKNLTIVDKLTYAGDLARIKEVKDKIDFYKADIADAKKMSSIFAKVRPHTVVHFAAETHVDRSIKSAAEFLTTNVIGTQNLINCSREFGVKKFIHISTDEVYGANTCGKKVFKETDPLNPQNPYSASKASAELLIQAAQNTYDFPALIIRPANNYGPWQYPEKLIPVIVSRALNNQKVPVYGRGKQIREWLYVEDCVRGIELILNKGKLGQVYNIGSGIEQEKYPDG
jgi:dTDP-glucose 4,6-dehydratase